LLNGDKKAKLTIMKILHQLLKFNSKSGPYELYPNWNVIVSFLNLSYGEIKDKDFELFSQAVVILLNLSSKPAFVDKVNTIELFKHAYDGIVYKQYKSRDLEMKNIYLEVSSIHRDRAQRAVRREHQQGRQTQLSVPLQDLQHGGVHLQVV
jgi:hypothetical protein